MRRLATAAGALLLPIVALLAALAAVAHGSGAPAIPTTPLVSLRTLAESPVSIEAGDFAPDRAFQAATRTFSFSLPAGTVTPDPTNTWFLLDLDYRITFAPDSADGFAWVSAATNNATAAQLEYELIRTDALTISESRVTLVDGQEERRLEGLTANVEYTNYARDQGLRDGDNSFNLRVEHTDGVKIQRIDFYGSTGVSTTMTTPYPLGIEVTSPNGNIYAGDEFLIDVTVENRTGVDLGDVELEVFPADEIAQPLDGSSHAIGPLAGTAEHTFRFEALRSGPGQITVLGNSKRNTPSAIVDLVVLPASGNRTHVLVLIALAAVAPVAVLSGIAFLRTRRRSPA